MALYAATQDSDVEIELMQSDARQCEPITFQPRRMRCKVPVTILISISLMLGVLLAVVYIAPRGYKSVTESMQQLGEVKTSAAREKCSKTSENCMATSCCALSGYECYEVHTGYAKCMKSCTPGVNGTCRSQAAYKPAARSSVSASATNLFCFSFYMENTGSDKPSYQLELLRTSISLGASIFGCEAWRVYSDVSTWLSEACSCDEYRNGATANDANLCSRTENGKRQCYPLNSNDASCPGDMLKCYNQAHTIQVHDKDGDFHFAKRRFKGTWVNSGIYIQVWKAIKEEGLWSSKDWTVKVDPDTVFLPIRLRSKLEHQEVTDNGIYLENCKYVNYGFFGDIEVFSRKAVATYIANLDDCKMSLNWKGSEKDTNWQPWGEDLFAQRCMDLHGVDKVAAWDITTNGLCEAYRPEGQKKNKKWRPDCATTFTPALKPFPEPTEYFECLKATQR